MRQTLSGLAFSALALLTRHATPAATTCGSATAVADETDLNNAITAFNAVAAGPCIFTIYLNVDIPLASNLPDIYNVTPDVSLIIEGNRFVVAGQDTPGVRPFAVQANTTVTNSGYGL